MKNSYVDAVLGLYTGIFTDIRVALPTVSGIGRDESRLSLTARTRGLSYLTIDLPAFGKHFDKCLALGELSPSNVPSFGTKKGRVMPVFLRGLLSLVFSTDGMLLSPPCPTAIFFVRQICYAVKKIKVECGDAIREQTLRNYINNELSLRSPYLNWYDLRIDAHRSRDLRLSDEGQSTGTADLFGSPIDSGICDIVHEVADRVFTKFGSFDPSEWRPKHGPGAIADGNGNTYKYDFPTWSARLEESFPYADLAHANYGVWAARVRDNLVPLEREVPSVALTVPKSQKGPRIIAKEPAAAMWCQQIIRDYLETGVSRSFLRNCISFGDQRNNQVAAHEASITGSHWTVDLKDASDRLTLWLVERLIRKNDSLLQALHSSRSQYCEVPIQGGHELIRMKKFAPQGSATTFPLQTIVYAILAISSVIHSRGEQVTDKTVRRASLQVRVFGDDTVIPDYAGEQYLTLLGYCGFLVNYDKTFRYGKFRESCGHEVYDGVDVTPAYITNPYDESSPSSLASTVECANNFFKKGLWHSAAALESTLPQWVKDKLRVVHIEEGAFGLSSFVGSYEQHLKRRYCGNLQRDEVRALTLIAEVPRTEIEGTGPLLQYFTERPAPDILWMSGDRKSVV